MTEGKYNFKFIDLFCGIGGFHVALDELGGECVLACDSDKYCREIYEKNYGITPLPDVRKIDTEDMPDFDVLCAGFPFPHSLQYTRREKMKRKKKRKREKSCRRETERA